MKNICLVLVLCTIVTMICGQQRYQWAVVGAGPAGIISVALLHEYGIDPADIVWIDPEFAVGRLGNYYGNVPSNQKAYRMTQFFSQFSPQMTAKLPSLKTVQEYDQEQEPPLQLLVDPLQEMSNYLAAYSVQYRGIVHSFDYNNSLWALALDDCIVYADNVIVATGAHPKRYTYEGPEEIPLDYALDEQMLRTMIEPDDVVMVIGSAHSAILILKYLAEMPVKKVINVYNKPLMYGLFGGLEGITARWAQAVLETGKASHISRIPFDADTIEEAARVCTKIIYACGYERNPLLINGSTTIPFDERTGIIFPHLYGIGIAFPETFITDDGITVHLIGINTFMEYARDLIPQWMQQ